MVHFQAYSQNTPGGALRRRPQGAAAPCGGGIFPLTGLALRGSGGVGKKGYEVSVAPVEMPLSSNVAISNTS